MNWLTVGQLREKGEINLQFLNRNTNCLRPRTYQDDFRERFPEIVLHRSIQIVVERDKVWTIMRMRQNFFFLTLFIWPCNMFPSVVIMENFSLLSYSRQISVNAPLKQINFVQYRFNRF